MNKCRYFLTGAFFFLFFSIASFGQNKVPISGVVLDSQSNEPLIGAYVTEKGTTNATVTNVNGEFSLMTLPNSTLVVSYIGYLSKEVSLTKNNQKLTILLEEKNEHLDEVVVIGYGVQKKSDITGAISSVSGKDINDVPVASPLEALQGKASGVNIIQNTGSPGSSTTIQIRGIGTVNDADPLYVVDGFIVNDINHLNPNDIENIEILKDAASGAIYGARGANGVVLITTKKGKQGKTKISYDQSFGLSTPWKKIKVLNLEQYALVQDYINGESNYSVDGKLYNSKNGVTGEYYYDESKYERLDTIRRNSPSNWWNAITRIGTKQQYNLSVSGGNEKNKFLVSGNYYNEQGIIKTSSYDKFNTHMNLDNQLSKWLDLTTSIMYTNESRHIIPEGNSSILKTALSQSPLTYTYNSRGYYSSNHPIAILDRNHNQMQRHRMDLNMSLNAKLGKLFTYQFRIADYAIFENWTNFYEVNKLDQDFDMTDLTTVSKYQTFINKWEINNLLTYNWNNDIHDISILAGQTIEDYSYNNQSSTRKGTASNLSNLWYLSSAYTGDKTNGGAVDWSAIGFVSRVNYALLNRYLLQANFRTDASSIFSESERWGYFPSISFGWKFNSEPFMKNINWLSLGKFRIGWGQLGNNRIDASSRYTLINTGYNYAYGLGSSTISPGSTSTSIGNSGIHWEKTETFNVGIDLGLFKNKLMFSAEYFNRLTTDMLLQVPVTLSAGLDDAPMTNAGSVLNRGIELSFDYRGSISELKYDVGFNITFLHNEVVSLGTGNEPIYGGYLSESSILTYVTKTAVGRPIGSFYGYVTDGIFDSYEEVKESDQYDSGKNLWEQTTQPGDFRFKDLNGDGKITAEDRTYLGSPIPKYTFGIPMSFSWTNFSLNLLLQGQVGNKIFNVMEYYLNNAATGNLYANIRNLQWSGQLNSSRTFYALNLDGTVPDLNPDDAALNFRASDFYVKDDSYMRLKELRFTYTFDDKISSMLYMSNLALYVSAYNLLTFTKYDGLDPEVGKVYGTEGNNLNIGVDQGNYPQARAIIFGIKIDL